MKRYPKEGLFIRKKDLQTTKGMGIRIENHQEHENEDKRL